MGHRTTSIGRYSISDTSIPLRHSFISPYPGIPSLNLVVRQGCSYARLQLPHRDFLVQLKNDRPFSSYVKAGPWTKRNVSTNLLAHLKYMAYWSGVLSSNPYNVLLQPEVMVAPFQRFL